MAGCRSLSSAFVFSLGLILAALTFSQTAGAQSYNQLQPLNKAQEERLDATSAHVRVDKPVSNFGEVEAGLYRSGEPANFGEMKALAKMGVRTIVDLEIDKTKIAQEAIWAKSTGIKFVSIPLSGFFAPSDKAEARIQKLMGDQAARPLLFHCAHGMERTGLAAALYRVYTSKWTATAAYKEMKDYGFHPITFPMKEYLEDATHSKL